MTDLLKQCDELLAAAEKAAKKWTTFYEGSADQLKCAILLSEDGHMVQIDHRRDYSDPKHDADFFVLATNLAPELAREVKRLWELSKHWSVEAASLEVELLNAEENLEEAECEVKRLSECADTDEKCVDLFVDSNRKIYDEYKKQKEVLKEAVELLSKFGHGIAGQDEEKEAREFVEKIK